LFSNHKVHVTSLETPKVFPFSFDISKAVYKLYFVGGGALLVHLVKSDLGPFPME
jgi:hypothetical protein